MGHSGSPREPSDFDSYAHDYEGALDRGLAISGETASFFARERIAWLARRLDQIGFAPRTVLDYGCGTGNSTSFFIDILGVESVVGLDLSAKSLEVARTRHGHLPAEYHLIHDYEASQAIDLIFCNGVFHHIPVPDRPRVVRFLSGCLRPNGVLALWDNNPWNPGTRYIMKRIPFDRDAVPISARQACTLVTASGLEVLRTDFCFVFPAALRALRGFEPWLAHLPVGAQYLVLCRRGRQAPAG